jgi:hypothetical protein
MSQESAETSAPQVRIRDTGTRSKAEFERAATWSGVKTDGCNGRTARIVGLSNGV